MRGAARKGRPYRHPMPAASLARTIFPVKDLVTLNLWYANTFGWKLALDERAGKRIEPSRRLSPWLPSS